MSTPRFSSSTTAEEVGTAFAEEVKGKNVLITGTSVGGIGFEAARVMALKGANLVIIVGQNPEKLKIAEETIKKEIPTANIRPLILDLSSLASVRKAAAEVNAMPEALHVVIHNAAAPAGPFKLTSDNLEVQDVTNHIAPFLFTKLIAAKILAARTVTHVQYTPRVVFVSGSGQEHSPGVDFGQLERPDPAKHGRGIDALFRTKCMNILFAIELCRRSKGQINAYSLHPGVIYTNFMQKEDMAVALKEWGLVDEGGRVIEKADVWKTIPQGAATTVAAAFDPSLNDKPGTYLMDCIAANEKLVPHTSDPAIAEQLWVVTERIIGESFTF
ncbi:short-chain dehydrogenase/reductase family protein [Favolaschia claudopus]|uniref:Short-chain dehydrogenase/reductase family protein n=1 Tax=Favolaschia claudopus TaxID=2862362 RepID=A0AAW0CGA5_9AGAR